MAVSWATAGAAGIVLVGRNAKTLQLTESNIAKASQSVIVLTLPTDVTIESDVKMLFEKTKAKFGNVHVLINSAGSMAQGMVGDAPLTSWWGDFVRGDIHNGLRCLRFVRKSMSKEASFRFKPSSRRSAARVPLST